MIKSLLVGSLIFKNDIFFYYEHNFFNTIIIVFFNSIIIVFFNTILIVIINTIFIVIFIVSNNAGKTIGILRYFKSNSLYCSFQPTSERTRMLLASLWMSVSSVSVAIFFLVFDLTASFITLYFSNSSKIIRNSSSDTLLSLKALEICEDMVFS